VRGWADGYLDCGGKAQRDAAFPLASPYPPSLQGRVRQAVLARDDTGFARKKASSSLRFAAAVQIRTTPFGGRSISGHTGFQTRFLQGTSNAERARAVAPQTARPG